MTVSSVAAGAATPAKNHGRNQATSEAVPFADFLRRDTSSRSDTLRTASSTERDSDTSSDDKEEQHQERADSQQQGLLDITRLDFANAQLLGQTGRLVSRQQSAGATSGIGQSEDKAQTPALSLDRSEANADQRATATIADPSRRIAGVTNVQTWLEPAQNALPSALPAGGVFARPPLSNRHQQVAATGTNASIPETVADLEPTSDRVVDDGTSASKQESINAAVAGSATHDEKASLRSLDHTSTERAGRSTTSQRIATHSGAGQHASFHGNSQRDGGRANAGLHDEGRTSRDARGAGGSEPSDASQAGNGTSFENVDVPDFADTVFEPAENSRGTLFASVEECASAIEDAAPARTDTAKQAANTEARSDKSTLIRHLTFEIQSASSSTLGVKLTRGSAGLSIALSARDETSQSELAAQGQIIAERLNSQGMHVAAVEVSTTSSAPSPPCDSMPDGSSSHQNDGQGSHHFEEKRVGSFELTSANSGEHAETRSRRMDRSSGLVI